MKDSFTLQKASVLVAIVGGIAAAALGIWQAKEGLEQRRLELRWNQAKMAKELNDKMLADKNAQAALRLLDSEGTDEVTPDQGKAFTASKEEYLKALRLPDRSAMSDKQKRIRGCFDALFFHMQLIEHYIEANFIKLEDIRFPLNYYVRKRMQGDKDVFVGYMVAFDLNEAQQLFNTLEQSNPSATKDEVSRKQ